MRLIIKYLYLGLIFYIGILCLGRFDTIIPDGYARLELAHYIVTEGSLITSTGPIKYAPLQSFLMAPFYAMGYYHGALIGQPERNMPKIGTLFVYYLFLPIIISSLCVLFFRILKKMGVDDNANLVSTFLLFTATFLLPYAGGLYSEPLSALLVLISFYYFYTAPAENYVSGNRKNFLCLGLLVLNNFIFVFYFALMVAYVFWTSRVNRKKSSEAWRMVLEGSLILGASVMLFLCYNYYRYEEFFNFGYPQEGFTSNWLVGMYGFMFSAGKGLLIYSPLTVFCVLYFLFKNHEMESWQKYVFYTTMISFFVFMSIYSKWGSWHGGWNWGPRFLLPFIPLVHLMFPLLLKFALASSRVLQAGIFLAVLWALGMNLLNYLDPSAVLPGPGVQLNAEEFSRRAFIFEKSVVFQKGNTGIFTMSSIMFLAGLGACSSMLWLWKKKFLSQSPVPQPLP